MMHSADSYLSSMQAVCSPHSLMLLALFSLHLDLQSRKTGAELLFETFNQPYERALTLVTSNLPFEEGNEVFGWEQLTGALLDRSPTMSTSWR